MVPFRQLNALLHREEQKNAKRHQNTENHIRRRAEQNQGNGLEFILSGSKPARDAVHGKLSEMQHNHTRPAGSGGTFLLSLRRDNQAVIYPSPLTPAPREGIPDEESVLHFFFLMLLFSPIMHLVSTPAQIMQQGFHLIPRRTP